MRNNYTNFTKKHTAAQWCNAWQIELIDDDGWRGHGKSIDDEIDFLEFRDRLNESTIRFCNRPLQLLFDFIG